MHFGKKFPKTEITQLMNTDGSMNEDPEEINKQIHHFYTKLYTQPDSDPQMYNKTIEDFLEKVLYKSLTAEHRDFLNQPLSLQELSDAVSKITPGKAPGPDGFSVNFYKKCWPIIGKYVFEAYLESFQKGELSITQKRGTIRLIPKKKIKIHGGWRIGGQSHY